MKLEKTHQDRAVFFLFLVLALSAIVFIAPWGAFPLNDDWVYTKNVLNSLTTGKFEVEFGQYAYAIPQVALGLFLVKAGEEPYLKLRWIGICCGLISVIFLCRLSEKALKQRSSTFSFLALISTFFFVPFFQPALSYMTDAPAFLFWVLSAWTLSLFIEKQNLSLWFLAFVASFVAVSQRQLAIFIPFSVVLARSSWFRFRHGWDGIRRLFKENYPIMFFAVPLLLLQWWWTQISPVKVPDSSFSPNPGALVRFSRHLIYLGWTTLPFLFVPSDFSRGPETEKIFRRLSFIFVLGLILHIANSFLFGSYFLPPFFGNVLDRVGILPVVLAGSAEVIFPDYFRFILFVLGFAGAVRILWGLTLLICDSSRNKATEVILWSSTVYFVFMCFRATQFDRYIIPVLPLSLLCILKTCSHSKLSLLRILGTLMCCLGYLVFSTTIVSDYFRWNEARREALEFAFSQGLKPDRVCGGYEYQGWYHTDPSKCTHTISFSELPNSKVERAFKYSSIWGSRERKIYLLEEKP